MAYIFDGNLPLEGSTAWLNGDFYKVIRDHFDAIAKNFAGTSFPSDPMQGQPCIRTDRGANDGVLYVFSGNLSKGENGWLDWTGYSRYYNHKKFISVDVSAANQIINIFGVSRIKLSDLGSLGATFSVSNFIGQNEGQTLIIVASTTVKIKNTSSSILEAFPQTQIQLKDKVDLFMSANDILTLKNIKTNYDIPMWIQVP